MIRYSRTLGFLLLLSLVVSFFIASLTLLFTYQTNCDWIDLFPCGTLRGFPLPILKIHCIDKCISMTPDNLYAVYAWQPVNGWILYHGINMAFWSPVAVAFVFLCYFLLNKNKKITTKTQLKKKTKK